MPLLKQDVPQSETFQISTITRFCGARTDPYIRYVASGLFEDLKFPVNGQRNVSNTLANLPVYFSGSEDALSFGWGPSHLVRDHDIHQGSYEPLSMVIAMSESFHEIFAARVLQEMTKTKAEPNETTPHISQWKAALHAFNGVFAAADFGLLVEDYTRLDPYHVIRAQELDAIFPPKLIADALFAFMRVTTGKEKHITFQGSAILAWFGAVAEWFCDLHVAVYESDGTQIYASHRGADVDVNLIYQNEPGIEWCFELWSPKNSNPPLMKTIDTTYSASIHKTPFGGRVTWESLLPRVFGKSFHYLDHEQAKALGGMIGGAAKLFQGLALGEGHEKHTELISVQNRNNPGSYGPGLVETLTNWLPELRRFQGRIERTLKLNHDEASQAYVDNLSIIRKACFCGICRSKEDLDKNMEGVPPPHGYCLATLVETIIALGLALSRMTVSSRIFPARAGIQSFYHSQVAKRLEARGKHWTEHFAIVYGNEWNAPDARRLQNAVQLFSGARTAGDEPPNLIALSHQGICAYLVTFEQSTTKDDAVKLIRVLSGGINIREKVFDRACLGPVEVMRIDDPWEEIHLDHLPEPLFCK